MTNAHLGLLASIRRADPNTPIPSRAELKAHLEDRKKEVGAKAFAEFAHLARLASDVWGPEETVHFGRVLRAARVSHKPAKKTGWEQAEQALTTLPEPWRNSFERLIAASKSRRRVKGQQIWSTEHIKNVIRALCRWHCHCEAQGLPIMPTGAALDAYAQGLVSGRKPVTTRTAADYLARILSGISIVAPDFTSDACSFVVNDWDQRAKEQSATTKTGAQLVGASEIYWLGFSLMEKAASSAYRGPEAAKDYRNGLLLALAAALPQRARALSSLAFDRSLWVDGTSIRVRIPADHLKGREDRKNGAPLDLSFQSPKLAAALARYRAEFRALLDDGDWLFPSFHSRGEAISAAQIGRLTGDITEKHFGIRVSIHQVRDNVATEASETLAAGGRAASALLGHRDLATTQRHYDHSQGAQVSKEFGVFIAERRGTTVDLLL